MLKMCIRCLCLIGLQTVCGLFSCQITSHLLNLQVQEVQQHQMTMNLIHQLTCWFTILMMNEH
uniref:MIER1 transcriptional regulator n=4 Tax=Cercopithecidae TaxID=9527 RepID=A0A2K5NF30_CERAT